MKQFLWIAFFGLLCTFGIGCGVKKPPTPLYALPEEANYSGNHSGNADSGPSLNPAPSPAASPTPTQGSK